MKGGQGISQAIGMNSYKIMSMERRSQQDVADEIGVSRPLVSTWTRGLGAISADQFAALAKLFDVPLEMLTESKPDELTPERVKLARKVYGLVKELGLEESYRRLIMAPPAEDKPAKKRGG